VTVSQHITLIDVTVNDLSALSKEAKKKRKIKAGTIFATMNFKLRPVRKENKHNQREKSGTRKVHTKP